MRASSSSQTSYHCHFEKVESSVNTVLVKSQLVSQMLKSLFTCIQILLMIIKHFVGTFILFQRSHCHNSVFWVAKNIIQHVWQQVFTTVLDCGLTGDYFKITTDTFSAVIPMKTPICLLHDTQCIWNLTQQRWTTGTPNYLKKKCP